MFPVDVCGRLSRRAGTSGGMSRVCFFIRHRGECMRIVRVS
jgi:hypothetical protein